jgi:hypothetical protein
LDDLDKQITRSGDDLDHCNWLERLSEITTDHPIKKEDLKHLKALSSSDILNGPSWTWATVLTMNKDEANRFERIGAENYAHLQKKVFIEWPVHISSAVSDEKKRFLLDHLPEEAFEIAIKGAPVFVTCNKYRNLFVGNGYPGLLHSICPDPEDDDWQSRIHTTDTGVSKVRSTTQPLSVNREIPKLTEVLTLGNDLDSLDHRKLATICPDFGIDTEQNLAIARNKLHNLAGLLRQNSLVEKKVVIPFTNDSYGRSKGINVKLPTSTRNLKCHTVPFPF